MAQAARLDATIVTTEKDLARLGGRSGARADLAAAALPFPIRLALDERDAERLHALLAGALADSRRGGDVTAPARGS